jgi:hypothetical protein
VLTNFGPPPGFCGTAPRSRFIVLASLMHALLFCRPCVGRLCGGTDRSRHRL